MIIIFKTLKLFIFYLYMVWNGYKSEHENFKQLWKCCENIVRGSK